MPPLDPEYLTFDYHCHYRGIPGPDHDPEDYPMTWTVSVNATVWDEDDDGDGEEVHVGDARFTIVPDAGDIELFLTLDAVDQELANVAEMLTVERPDLMPAAGMDLGGDLLVLSSLWIEPKFRGHQTGHTVLTAILSTVGRAAAMVILEAAPLLSDDAPEEDTPQHLAAKTALHRYWTRFGFRSAFRDYLVLNVNDGFGST
ncbi:hypothetical protein AB0N24_04600 [Arthrobacter sp. NPDC093128]|uniref:hypothetical protein n=1 Tax=Arthrobacter sp. NPDC093128 TaxID=3154979 RepID=UPI00343220E3